EFDRYAIGVGVSAVGDRRADCADRALVGFPIAFGIGGGEGRLTEHIEGVALMRRCCTLRTLQGRLDARREDESTTEPVHRRAHPDAYGRGGQPCPGTRRRCIGARIGGRRRQAHRQGQRRGQSARILPHACELIADQSVGVAMVHSAQQRFGQSQQRTASGTAERQLRQQIRSRSAASVSHAGGERQRQLFGAGGLRLIDARLAEQCRHAVALAHAPGATDRLAQQCQGRLAVQWGACAHRRSAPAPARPRQLTGALSHWRCRRRRSEEKIVADTGAPEASSATGTQWQLTADQRAVLEAADRFAREELYPLAQRMDEQEWWPQDVFARLGAEGFLGITVPQSYGGAGLDLTSVGLVAEAFSRWNHAIGLSWIAHDNLCVHNLFRHATEAQRRQHLPDLCSGRHVGALALTEPGAGSDALGSMRTTARREGDHYVLNGTKLFITNGPIADIFSPMPRPIHRSGRMGSPPSSSRRIRRACAWRRSSPRWAFAAARPASWYSPTAACRRRICSARKMAASVS